MATSPPSKARSSAPARRSGTEPGSTTTGPRRVAAVAAKTLGLVIVFTVAAGGGAVLHLGLAAPRRFLARQVSGILASTFKGRIVIQRVDELRLTRIAGVDGQVWDPEGHPVLYLRGLRARFSTMTVLRSMLGKGPLVVRIPELAIDGVEAIVEDDAAGEIGLSRAFDARNPSTSGGSGTNLSIPSITITHVWAHGHLAAVPVLDVDLEDVAASVAYDPKATRLALGHVVVRGRGLGAVSPLGTLVADATLPADPNGDTDASAHYDGLVGRIPLRLDGSMRGKRVDAVLDVPETEGAAVDPLAPGTLHLRAPVSAHAEVHGQLPVLEPRLSAKVGGGVVTGSAVVTMPEKPRTDLTASASVDAKDIDASLVAEGAPVTRVAAHVEATVVSKPEGKLGVTLHVKSEASEVAGQLVPAIDGQGTLADGVAKGTVHVAEAGAPTDVRFTLTSRPGETTPDQLAFDVTSNVADLDRVARIGHVGHGQAHLVGGGQADLHAKTMLATASVELVGAYVSSMRLARGVVTATAEGPWTAPHLVVKVLGADTSAGGYAFPRVAASAEGSLTDMAVSASLAGDDKAPSVILDARVTHPGDLVVSGTRVRISRKDIATAATVDAIRVGGGAVELRGLRLSGLGDPITASARLVGGSVTVKATAPDVDLSRVAKLLAREEDAKGHLSFDVDATATRAGARGKLEVHAHHLSDRGVDGASVDVTTAFRERRFDGKVSAKLGEAGALEFQAADVVLAGAPTDAQAWKNAIGAVSLDGRVDLDKLSAQIPSSARPTASTAGIVTLKGHASREADKGAAPAVSLEVSTEGLAIVGKQAKKRNPDGTVTLGALGFAVTGFDASLGVKLAPATGKTEVTAALKDVHGPAATLTASATVPLAGLLHGGDLAALLTSMPLSAKLVVPRRSLDTLPSAIGTPPVKADVELVAAVSGTARTPKLAVTVKASDLIARDAPACVVPVVADVKLDYDGAKATVDLTGSRAGTKILGASASVNVRSSDVLDHGTVAWDASSEITLDRFPLEAVAPLVQRNFSGRLSGTVKLADLHKAASVDAKLDLRAMHLDRVGIPSGKITVTAKDGKLTASARLDQTDGHVETTATGALPWGADVAPSLDLHAPIDVSLEAKSFRLNAAMPFLEGTLSELDGRLDTDAQLHIIDGGKDGTMKGALTIKDGSFELPQLGERFHALGGTVVMNPWGTVKFQNFAADGPTGHLTFAGDATMKGLTLQKAAAQLHIAKGHSVPIALDGVSMGRAYGDVKLTAAVAPDGKRIDVGVDVPMLGIDLPDSTGHAVQALDPDTSIRVGAHADDGDFVTLPLVEPERPRKPSETVIHASVELGKDTHVKRDTTVDVTANAKLDVLVTDKAHITGKVVVERGKLELEGKQFTIDHATVSFLGDDTSNPMVVATAYWDAADGTRVYADFSGLATKGKLKLRSEPSLSEDEILSLILFGSADGSFGAQPPPGQDESTGVKAAGMAGGIVTQGLNKAISGVTSVDVTTRVDTSEADNPRPELAVQLTKTVSARVGYKLGVPAPGENPDRTELTLDWRFVRNWSLTAEVGDQGSTALDVVWRLRY